MLKYILKSIKKYYDYFIFMVLGIFVIMTIFPLGVSSLLKIKVAVQGDITKYGRGQYDLLVRNEDSLTKVEKKLKLIDESYASNGKGGISMKQYDDLKKIKDIEIAAPIANLGYFPNDTSYVSIITEADRGNKIDITFNTWDGANKYKLAECNAYQIAGGKDFVDKDLGQINEEFDESRGIYKEIPYALGNGVSGVYGTLQYGEKKNTPVKTTVFKVPRTYSLLFAIDPEQEKGLSKKIAPALLNRKVQKLNNVQDALTGKTYDKVNKIDVITNREAPIRLEAVVKVRKLNASEENLRSIIEKEQLGKDASFNLEDEEVKNDDKLSMKGKNVINELEKYVDKEEDKGAINFNKLIIPFNAVNSAALNCVDGEFSAGGRGIAYETNVVVGTEHYMLKELEYEGDKDMLSPKPIGQSNGVMIFSDKEKKGISTEELRKGNLSETPLAFHVFANEEMFDEVTIQYGDKVNGAPSGIYGGDSIVQLEDTNGKRINRNVERTTELGSIGKVMPNGYTTLDAAPLLKGDKPIDAIRVKVAGITEYNNASKEKIESVATEIYNKTGLRVDFVAGSSTTKTQGKVDGIEGVSGLGKIEKRWVTLGTDSTVTTTWNTSAFILMMAFIACGCLFVVNRINSYMILRKREMNTLECTGWDKKYIALVITGENVLAYIISTIFALVVLINLKMDKTLIISSIIIIFFIIVLVSYLYTLRHKNRAKKRGYKSVSFSMVKLILSDIFRNRNRYILLMGQLVLTATLALFTLMSFNATKKAIDYTVLGSQVNMSTSSIVKPIIIGSIILIIFTTFDRFTSLMLERKQEITLLKTLGWSKGKISGLMYGSLIMIGILVTALTLALTSLIGLAFYKTIPIKGTHMAGIALMTLGVCVIGGIYPIVNSLRKTVLKYNGNDR